MHWRWAGDLAAVGPEQLGQLVGGAHRRRTIITNGCLLTTVVDMPDGPGRHRPSPAAPASPTRGACGRLRRCPTRPPSRHRPAAAPPTFDRAGALARLADEAFDVLVVGGGITGAGVALDAASRGLRTALVEKDDFASGTSSKSSKLVHGGLRYLQQREFRLVYENLAERQRLLENAPHLVLPLPFLIPLFGKRRGGQPERGPRLRDGPVALRPDRGDAHRATARAGHPGEALAHLPTLRTDRLVGRLPLLGRPGRRRPADRSTVLRTAVLDHGAVAANYTRGDRPPPTGPDGHGCDGARGRRPTAASRFDIRADGGGQRRRRLGRRGPHPRRGRAIPTRSGRPRASTSPCPESAFPCDIAAVIPVRRGPAVDLRGVVGATRSTSAPPTPPGTARSTTRPAPPRTSTTCWTRPTPWSPSRSTRSDVTGVWAGLRPLLAPADGRHAPSERTADLSRRHTVRTSADGVVTVTGGKLTTYRKMAEDTVDAGGGRTRADRRGGAPPGRSGSGAPAPPRRRPARAGGAGGAGRPTTRPEPSPSTWPAATGTRRPTCWPWPSGRPELLEPLVPGLPYLRVEAVCAVRHEMAGALDDVLARRTRAVLRDARATAGRRPGGGRPDRARARLGRPTGPRRGGRRGSPGRSAPTLAGGRPRPETAGAGRPTVDAASGERPPVTGPPPRSPRSTPPRGEVTERLGGTGWPSTTPCAAGWPTPAPRVQRRRRRPGRGRAGLVAPGHRLGRPRPGARARPALVVAPDRHGPGGGRPGRLPRGRRAGDPGRRAQRRVRRPRSRSSAAWPSTCAAWPASSTSTTTSLVADVRAGTFGPDLEAGLRARARATPSGHWPQSMDLSTVGGWLACRGAGQYSTRYGKIEDMVLGLEVVLADGRSCAPAGTGPGRPPGPT